MEDFLYRFLSIYQKLPLSVKIFFGKFYTLIPLRFRYGQFYAMYFNRINLFNAVSPEKIFEMHKDLLMHTVNKAIESVDFYRKYDKCYCFEDFEYLPIVTKTIIDENKNSFINYSLKGSNLKANTGGGAGTPFTFFIQKHVTRPKEKAHFNWYWGQFGYKTNDKILMIRGLPIRGGRHYEYMPIDNKLNISCYNIDDSCVNNIANVIQKFGPLFIHAYPSSLKILTELFIKHDVDINLPIKAIFLGSEYLTDSDKDLFSSYYKTKIVNWYGHSERLIHGGYCNENDEYHFYPFYGHIELIDQNDNVIRDPNIPGRIIATGFDNDVMPLIRYDTGDIGMWSDSEKCNCNRQMPIISKILGRTSDYIILSDKTKVSLTAFIFGQHFKEFVLIKEFQIVQNRIGFIEILMVPKEPFDKNIEHNFINKLKKSVQNKLQIKIIYVLNIKKTIRGKHRFLIQNVTE